MIGMTLNRRNSQNIVRKRPGRSRGGRPTERWSAGLVDRSALAGEGNVCLPPCATFCSPRLGQRSIVLNGRRITRIPAGSPTRWSLT